MPHVTLKTNELFHEVAGASGAEAGDLWELFRKLCGGSPQEVEEAEKTPEATSAVATKAAAARMVTAKAVAMERRDADAMAAAVEEAGDVDKKIGNMATAASAVHFGPRAWYLLHRQGLGEDQDNRQRRHVDGREGQ